MVPSCGLTCLPISLIIQSNAVLVLPAPVGAHINKFSSDSKAALWTVDCIKFSDLKPSKAG